MEKYLVASKPFLESTESKPKPVVKPIIKRPPIPKASTSKLAPLNLKKANKNLLKTLHLESNPITYSTAYERTEHVATWASGHESGHSGHGSGWNEMRRVKLLDQGNAKGKASGIFKGVRVYLNGATGNITNLALISLVQTNGGEVRMMQSAKCTHIISSTWLSGSKTQRFLSRKQNRSQVVHPNWIVESVAQGKRLQESNFSVIFHENQQSISSILGSSPDIRKSRASTHSSFGEVKNMDTSLAFEISRKGKEVVVLEDSDDEKLQKDSEDDEEEEEENWEFPPCGQSGRSIS